MSQRRSRLTGAQITALRAVDAGEVTVENGGRVYPTYVNGTALSSLMHRCLIEVAGAEYRLTADGQKVIGGV